jgi:hypothetical protein
MANKCFAAIGTFGNSSGFMDSIKTATISDQDICLVTVNSGEEFYVYTFDSGNVADESPPDVIYPEDAAGTEAWLLCDMTMGIGTIRETLAVTGTSAFTGNVTMAGDLAVTGAITGASFTGTITITGDVPLTDSSNLTADANPATDHNTSGFVSEFTAGENVAFGNFCYFKSDGKMWKSDADASTTMPLMAMAVDTTNADATGTFMLWGYARDDTWNWTVGGLLYASTTAGEITQTAPSGDTDQVQAVGVAIGADYIWFLPDFTLVEVTVP